VQLAAKKKFPGVSPAPNLVSGAMAARVGIRLPAHVREGLQPSAPLYERVPRGKQAFPERTRENRRRRGSAAHLYPCDRHGGAASRRRLSAIIRRMSKAAPPNGLRATRAARRPLASPEPAQQVLRRFRLVFNAIKTHFRQVEKKAGVGGAQLWALFVVREQPGIGVSELARAMDIHQSTASNLVRSLVDQALVAVEKGGTDRRAVQLRLTPGGMRVLKKAPGPFTGVLPQALASLDVQTLKRLDRDLGRLIEVLGADERAAQVHLSQIMER
jgi:DNA-binding MarR family transcriptional regulator